MARLLWWVIGLGLAGIVASLGVGLFHLARGGPGDSRRLARALGLRIALSLMLFALLMLAWYLGLISPHTLAPAAAPHP
jgi:hypothetical protein